MLTLRSGKSQSQGLVVLYYNYKIRDVKESQYAKFVCTMMFSANLSDFPFLQCKKFKNKRLLLLNRKEYLKNVFLFWYNE